MGSSLEIHLLSPKTVIMISKLVYQQENNHVFDLVELNHAIKKIGIRTELNLDVSFIFEVIQLNESRFNDNTITVENIVLPELKEVEVDYYRTYSETVNYYYKVDLKSFSKKRGIINNFFRYDEGADYVEIDNYQEYDKEHHDTEYLDGGINDIT
jgi:hypothetical protein